MFNPDITILIQGPLNDVSLNKIETYKKYGNVLISTWDSAPTDHVLETKVVNKLPKDKRYRQKTADYQFYGISYGLNAVKTKYTIKVRSDEYYENLTPLIEKFLSNPDQIVFGNIFFIKWAHISFHIGDHIWMGLTNTMKLAYDNLIFRPEKYTIEYCAEISLAKAILDAKGAEHSKDEFLCHFDVMDINEMIPFQATHNAANVTYFNRFDETNMIKSMDQL
jgi:hypothetical protein